MNVNLTSMKNFSLVKTMNKLSLLNSISNLTHMESINSLSLVKNMDQLSLIKIIKNPGWQSVGGRLSASLKNESSFDCVRCSILILLIKTVRCNIVRRSIHVPHCILNLSTTLISPNANLDILFSEDTTGIKHLKKL